MSKNEIKVRVNRGYLIAGENPDPNYPGIYIAFETDDGDIIDVVFAECKLENNCKNIDVYCYEDAYNEDFTRKYTLVNDEIYKAING